MHSAIDESLGVTLIKRDVSTNNGCEEREIVLIALLSLSLPNTSIAAFNINCIVCHYGTKLPGNRSNPSIV
jgi:hypothetical protein